MSLDNCQNEIKNAFTTSYSKKDCSEKILPTKIRQRETLQFYWTEIEITVVT